MQRELKSSMKLIFVGMFLCHACIASLNGWTKHLLCGSGIGNHHLLDMYRGTFVMRSFATMSGVLEMLRQVGCDLNNSLSLVFFFMPLPSVLNALFEQVPVRFVTSEIETKASVTWILVFLAL
jgi:hypothetical protein